MSQIEQLDLISWRPKGQTINLTDDLERLSAQMRRVYDVMKDGERRGLEKLGRDAQCPPASASARFRDLKALGYPMKKQNLGGGRWVYWMEVE